MDAERWKQVDELLQSALAVPFDRRDEFLRQVCAGDAELEQEVRSLLTSHRNLGGFLERPAIRVAAQTIARAEAREAGDSVLGRTISHYRSWESWAAAEWASCTKRKISDWDAAWL